MLECRNVGMPVFVLMAWLTRIIHPRTSMLNAEDRSHIPDNPWTLNCDQTPNQARRPGHPGRNGAADC
eukprot:261756-Rhodomonas_salina.1